MKLNRTMGMGGNRQVGGNLLPNIPKNMIQVERNAQGFPVDSAGAANDFSRVSSKSK